MKIKTISTYAKIYLLDPRNCRDPKKPDYVLSYYHHPLSDLETCRPYSERVILFYRGVGFSHLYVYPVLGRRRSQRLKHLRILARAYFDPEFKKAYERMTGNKCGVVPTHYVHHLRVSVFSQKDLADMSFSRKLFDK